jgi:hypothetical protein
MLVIQAPMEQVGQAELQVRLEQRVQQELLVTQALTVLVELEVLLVELEQRVRQVTQETPEQMV